MIPPHKTYLHTTANNEQRIGENKRSVDAKGFRAIEEMLDELGPMTTTCDVRPIQPPNFTEFLYFDCLGGLMLATMSAEINCRVAAVISEEKPAAEFNRAWIADKYVLDENIKTYDRIIFLAGCNSAHLMDQQRIMDLVDNHGFYLKPHPVVTEGFIKDLGATFGYHKVIDPSVSGMTLLKNCEVAGSTHCSELYIVARILGKQVVDITRPDRAWNGTYHHVCRLLDNTDKDIERISALFMNDRSGFLRPNDEIDVSRSKAENYMEAALIERKPFELLTTQRLVPKERTHSHWNEARQ